MPAFTLSNPPGLYDPTPHDYSQVAVVEAGTKLIMISGQGGDTPDGPPPPSFEDQARQAFKNIRIALESVGARVEDVAKLTILIVDYDADRLAARVLSREHIIYPTVIRWIAEGRVALNGGRVYKDGKPLHRPVMLEYMAEALA